MKFNLFILFIITIYVISQGCERSTETRGGFALHFGMGTMFGEYGIAGEYQFVVKQKLRLTPSIGIGLLSAGWLYNIGYSIGCDIEIGKKHRLTIGPRFGTIHKYFVHNPNDTGSVDYWTSGKLKSDLGPSLEVGYKGETFFGLLWLVRTGIGFNVTTRKEYKNKIVITPSLGLGWKF